MSYQPKTGQRCSCRKGVQRDNCPNCEGTGMVIDFAAIRAQPIEIKNFRVSIVASLGPHLQFFSDSQDVQPIKEDIGADAEGYDSFFVATKDGDYTEVWGMSGIIPYRSKLVTRLIPKEQSK